MDYKLKINDTKEQFGVTKNDDDTLLITTEAGEKEVSFIVVDDRLIRMQVGDRCVNAYIMDHPDGKTVMIDGKTYAISDLYNTSKSKSKKSTDTQPDTVTPPMPAIVARVLVEKDQAVEKGQGVIVVSAMKMETTLTAPFDGVVENINAAEGDKVNPGDILVDIKVPN